MIKSITITIDGKDIGLTLDQAKELKSDLDSIFEAEKVFWPINTWPNRPSPVYQPDIDPYKPYCDDTGHAPLIEDIKITCVSSAVVKQ